MKEERRSSGVEREGQMLSQQKRVLLIAFSQLGEPRLRLDELKDFGVAYQLRAQPEWAELNAENFAAQRNAMSPEKQSWYERSVVVLLVDLEHRGVIHSFKDDQGVIWFEMVGR